jgi:plastocyanin
LKADTDGTFCFARTPEIFSTINSSLNLRWLPDIILYTFRNEKIYINLIEWQRMQMTFIQTTSALAIPIIALLLLGLVSIYTTNSEAAGQGTSKNEFKLSAKLDNSVNPPFTWINPTDGVINPTLNFKVNTNDVIQIQNPTQTLHQLIIDSNGKQIATSGDITPGNSGQVSVKPDMTGTFGYHCLYHPDTMKGIIQVH